jgi:hypothetical protein
MSNVFWFHDQIDYIISFFFQLLWWINAHVTAKRVINLCCRSAPKTTRTLWLLVSGHFASSCVYFPFVVTRICSNEAHQWGKPQLLVTPSLLPLTWWGKSRQFLLTKAGTKDLVTWPGRHQHGTPKMHSVWLSLSHQQSSLKSSWESSSDAFRMMDEWPECMRDCSLACLLWHVSRNGGHLGRWKEVGVKRMVRHERACSRVLLNGSNLPGVARWGVLQTELRLGVNLWLWSDCTA